MAYEKEAGPLGAERGDWNAALVAHTVATMLGSSDSSHELKDFVLRWGKRRRQSVQDQLLIFRALASQGTKDDASGDNR